MRPPSSPPPVQPDPPAGGPIRADLAHRASRGRRSRRVIAAASGLGLSAAALFLGVWLWRYAFSDLPPLPDKAALWSLNRPAGATFLDRFGGVIGQRGPLHGAPLTLAVLPPYVPQAFLAAEDHNFYRHWGLDPVGILRAARNDVMDRRRTLQGGSTLTQQIARTLFLTPEQTVRRKLQEAVLAVQIERLMSKSEILELYLNRIYFGAGAYGVEAAANTYFGVDAKDLSVSQAALLAALPKAPTQLSPTNDLAAATLRSKRILASMRALGWLSAADETSALDHPPRLAPQSRTEGDFGYILDLAAKEAHAANVDKVPDLVIQLTIDPRLQAAATEAVRDAVRQGGGNGVSQGALVALEPDAGVLALVGGIDHRQSAFDRATQALRQPGSAFKPMVYAAALEAGMTPLDVRQDAPIAVGDWRPQNADGVYSGAVTLSDALARSLNTVAVRVSQEVGAAKVAALARRFGLINLPLAPSPAIALGAYEVTPLDLASAYQVLQQGGVHSPPYLIANITNARGDLIFRHSPPGPAHVYDPGKAAEMVQMMQAVIAHGTGRRADIGRPAAGKTGTSQDYRDAWFIGFTPDVLTAVWLGDDRGRPMRRVSGGELPAETWRRFMLTAEDGLPIRSFAPPPEPAVTDASLEFYGALADQFDQAAAADDGAASGPAAPSRDP